MTVKWSSAQHAPHISSLIPQPNLPRRQLHGEGNPPRCLPHYADETGVCDRCIPKSSATDGVRFPEPAGLAERFQTRAVVIDDEHRHGAVPEHSGDVRADLLHEPSRFHLDDVPSAFRGYEQVLAVGHHEDRANAHVTDLETSDPRLFADPDAEKNAASGVPVFWRDGDDRFT